MMNETIQAVRHLTSEERLTARETARQQVIRKHGDAPTVADFQRLTLTKYPREVQWLATGLLVAGLIAAFLPSMFRIFNIARNTFLGTIPDWNQASVTGASIVLLGETMMIICLLAVTVFEIVGVARKALYVVALCAFAFTLSGNWTIANPNTPFGYMEAVFPPMFTLALAFILERRALSTVEGRHAVNQRYEAALTSHQARIANPEADAGWSQVYANGLRDALVKKNARRKEVLDLLTTDDWRVLVNAELATENWFTPSQDASQAPISDKSAGFVDNSWWTDSRLRVLKIMIENQDAIEWGINKLAAAAQVGNSTADAVRSVVGKDKRWMNGMGAELFLNGADKP